MTIVDMIALLIGSGVLALLVLIAAMLAAASASIRQALHGAPLPDVSRRGVALGGLARAT